LKEFAIAVIDLRSVTLWITDGSTPTTGGTTGAVAHTAGYPAILPFTTPATSTILVSGFTAALLPGEYLQFASHMQFYEIISSVGGATPTSVTIYPALLQAITNSEVITVLGNGIYAKLGEGNLTYSEKRNLIYVRDRGFIDTMKIGDDEPVDVSMDFTWEFLRSATGDEFTPTFEEAIKQVGAAANWVSTALDPCEPYCVNVWLLDIPPCGSDAESIQLPEFRWTGFDHDLKGGKVSVKATCNVLQANVVHSTTP
jgi:hypothetical protein